MTVGCPPESRGLRAGRGSRAEQRAVAGRQRDIEAPSHTPGQAGPWKAAGQRGQKTAGSPSSRSSWGEGLLCQVGISRKGNGLVENTCSKPDPERWGWQEEGQDGSGDWWGRPGREEVSGHLAGRWPKACWQEPPGTQPQRTAAQGRGRGQDGSNPAPHGATPTCCWAWILMYSALCLPCLLLSGLPAWLCTAFSREAPGVTTFMGGTLPPPLCRKRNRVGLKVGSHRNPRCWVGSLGLGPLQWAL